MRYTEFKKFVQENAIPMAVLRGEVPHREGSPALLLMDRLGLDAYERFVLRLEREQAK